MRHSAIKIMNVVGARPNFMKIAPVIREMKKYKERIVPILIHTGQHYDDNMSKVFFNDLDIPKPNIYLGIGSGTHSEQVAKIMIAFEKLVLKEKPDLVVVVGDVNSTLACSLVTSKLNIKLAHVESGLRSFDRTMPEEINRLVTDSLSDYLFVTEESGLKNLKREGIENNKIHFVGNVMIDTLIKLKTKSEKSLVLKKIGLKKNSYAVLTLHRPSNVDNKNTLLELFEAFETIGKHIPVIFPIHPRTMKQIKNFKIQIRGDIRLIDPLGYLDFLKLYMNSKFVLTDSGGIQEETTYLGIPCLTLRHNTERPVTIKKGTNILVGTDKDKIIKESNNILTNNYKSGTIPQLWDGKAALRIVNILKEEL